MTQIETERLTAWIESTWARMCKENPDQTILDRPLARPIGQSALSPIHQEDEDGQHEQQGLFS
jgi:hypothetical protein